MSFTQHHDTHTLRFKIKNKLLNNDNPYYRCHVQVHLNTHLLYVAKMSCCFFLNKIELQNKSCFYYHKTNTYILCRHF